MSVVIVARGAGVAGEAGRWSLPHGRDPVDLLAENGWAGNPVHAALDPDGRIEVHYAVVALDEPIAPVAMRQGRARVRQRVGAYAIVVDEDRVLMSRLADWVGDVGGRWTLPGGGVDPGEEPWDAVVRECHEETGQHVVVDELVQIQSQHWAGAEEDFHAVRLVYRAHCPQPVPARVVEVDGSTGQAAWVPLDRLPGLAQVGMVAAASSHLP